MDHLGIDQNKSGKREIDQRIDQILLDADEQDKWRQLDELWEKVSRKEKLRLFWLVLRLDMRDWLISIKQRVWNKNILLFWNRLWIRKDELDKSLNIDPSAMFVMTKEERNKYLMDLAKRRQIAHERDED